MWLHLQTTPAMQIGGGSDGQAARYAAQVSVSPIDLGGDANANATITITRAPAQARRALLRGAVGAVATVYRDSVAVYAGTVDGLALDIGSRSIRLQVQS